MIVKNTRLASVPSASPSMIRSATPLLFPYQYRANASPIGQTLIAERLIATKNALESHMNSAAA